MKLESKLKSFHQEGGFTLIEMLIVVAIVGILVAIAVPALNTAKADAQEAKQDAVLSAVSLAKTRFELKATTAEITAFDALDQQEDELLIIGPYMRVNGVQPVYADLLEGTGKGSLAINAIGTEPQFFD